jgi:hypothetical protein
MGCSDNGGGGDHHPTTYYEYFEKILIPGLKKPIPGLKRRVEIRINRIESLQDEYASGVETHLLFMGKSVHRTFYPVHSLGANAFLQKYQPKFATKITEESNSSRAIRTAHARRVYI